MSKKKAKWLEEATTPELLVMLQEILTADEVDAKKAQKITAEITERTPQESEAVLSVGEALEALEQAMTAGINAVNEAYQAELEAVGDADEDEEEAEEEEEASPYENMSLKELKAAAREAGIKVSKDMDKDDLIAALSEVEEEEAEEEEEADDEEAEDYEEMSQKELKTLCRERGIKVNKSMKKSDFIKALEADDK